MTSLAGNPSGAAPGAVPDGGPDDASGGVPGGVRVGARVAPAGVSVAGRLLLVLALVQGTSVTLSLALRLDGSGRAAALVTLAWLASYALALHTLLRREAMARVVWLVRYRLLLLVLVTGTLGSALWSVDPGLTVERSVHLLGSTLVALAIGFTVPLATLLRIAAVVLGAIMVASIAAALLLPGIGIEDYEGRAVWRGVTASKNTLGFWAAVATLLFVSRALETDRLAERAARAAMAALSLVCLAASVSATSALALGCGLAAMAYLHVAVSLRLGGLAAGALALLGAALVAFALGAIDTAELIGRSGDLTGRAELWEQTRALIAARPLTGYGYGTLWYPTEASLWIQQSLLDLTWITYHAHNGPLQLASEVGVPLTALALLFAFQQLLEIVHCRYRRADPGLVFTLGFMAALLVSNYAEARLVVNRELYWILMVALPVSMLRQVTVAMPTPFAATAAAHRLSPAARAALAGRRRDRIARTAMKTHLSSRLDERLRPGASATDPVVDTVRPPSPLPPTPSPGDDSPQERSP